MAAEGCEYAGMAFEIVKKINEVSRLLPNLVEVFWISDDSSLKSHRDG